MVATGHIPLGCACPIVGCVTQSLPLQPRQSRERYRSNTRREGGRVVTAAGQLKQNDPKRSLCVPRVCSDE